MMEKINMDYQRDSDVGPLQWIATGIIIKIPF